LNNFGLAVSSGPMKTALAYLVIAIAVVVALWTIVHGFPFI
jgi:hypothetical protein